MSDRGYRALVGTLLLLGLYLERPEIVWGLIGLMLFEGVTNFRLPLVLQSLFGSEPGPDSQEPDIGVARIAFDAERAWRLVVATLLFLSYHQLSEQLWFFPWFMGFAILGAGISGVCPVLMALKALRFR
ncbi:hypothetical protein [Thiohalobacter sp.]|uniref:hypothetical protein n=1 Tax=Thiohalobacter sp. TaxID=2025948 RepID=UPI00260EAB9A|nr:hypothetical protein [Thiohalobacter sp.]